ncbi:MAG: sensor histidine kinase, partial [Eubacteriales bacterium]
MKLFLRYLRQRWRGIAAGGVFGLIFAGTFVLYHLPVEAVGYPAGICVLLGLLLLLLDFRRVKRKHETLTRVRTLTDVTAASLSQTDKFPSADGIEDEDYQNLLHLLAAEHNAYRTETDRRFDDMVDYYTVWAHQIKTPIASMRLHLQNEDSALSRTLMSDLFRVEQYAEMVLTFLRLDADSTDYVIRECDLDAIVRPAVKKFAGEFILRKLRLVYEPLCTTVITDEKWLSFVLEQVLSNALKYTPSGSITIALEPEKTLCIRDTGIGIAPEDLPRIFENGYTGGNGRLDKKATGIGLYLCKRICTNLGHRITAESAGNAGTTIRIDLSQVKEPYTLTVEWDG